MLEEIIKKAIARDMGDGFDPGLIAASVSRVVSSVYAEVALVVGSQAAAALCDHAVHRTRSTVVWTMPPNAVVTPGSLGALRADLAARPSKKALEAGLTLLFALSDHLISLIGLPLTQRIFRRC